MTSTLKDQQAAPTQTLPGALGDYVAAKQRLSCTACSVPGNHRYATASHVQQASPITSRRNSKLKNLTPLSNSSSQDSLITNKITNHPHNNNINKNQNHTLDLSNLNASSSSSSSSSLQGSGFKLNFNTGQSQPKIKCHIDHLHQDLALDVNLDSNEDNNNDMTNNSIGNSSRFTLNCYNPTDPNSNIKLRVELVKTSAKGFGLRIIQHMPSSTESSNEALLASKREKARRNKSDGESRRTSIKSESSRNIPKPNDISELDEVRISSGKLSKVGDDGEDHCRCTTPCGAPGCKAKEIPKEQEVDS